MDVRKIVKVDFNDMNAVYIISKDGQVGFSVVPSAVNNQETADFQKGRIDPLVQLSVTGDASSIGFAAGETRHNSALTMSLHFVSQKIIGENPDSEVKTVITTLESDSGIRVEHILSGYKNSRSINLHTHIINASHEEINIEAISSFNISGISPYADDSARNRLFLHRFRSRWSEEGRHEVRTIEDLLLEPSWADFGVRCEKFGAIGSMPIRGFFPVALVEDTKAGVVWGVTNACSSSWQIELIRIDDNLCISGGLADYEFGHFRKTLKPGDDFNTPESYITAVKGDWTLCCDRMLDAQRDRCLNSMKHTVLPSFFNEYCTTWGEPSEKTVNELLKFINGNDFDYFVIDAGWYADSVKGWQDNMGDWNVASDLFPNGLKPVVKSINDAGMKAGIWFELEVVGKDADVVDDVPHLLTRDGHVIISGTRRFWDMRSEWVDNYLTEKVIDFLNENGFEYIKIDYNDTIGIGCDGAESVGEGLRQCVEATKRFYRKIREQVPGIAIEVCSSGGHRLEPGFMELADFLSFSDAHEEKEIPVIAADLQRLILPSKSQIWAVLRKTDPLKRIAYSVCAGMYGALCISGDVFDLSENQWKLALLGTRFYKKASGIIANGFTRRFGPFQTSNRELMDYQASVRYGLDGDALVIVHTFNNHSGEICVPVEGDYEIADKYETGDHKIALGDGMICFTFEEDFDAVAVILKKK